MPTSESETPPPPTPEALAELDRVGFKLAVSPGPGSATLTWGPDRPNANGSVLIRDDGLIVFVPKGKYSLTQYSVPPGERQWTGAFLTKTDQATATIPAGGEPEIGIYQDGLTAGTYGALCASLGITGQIVLSFTDGATWATIGSFNPLLVPGCRNVVKIAMAPNTLEATDDMVAQIQQNIGVFTAIAERCPKGTIYVPGWEGNGNEGGGGYVWAQHGCPAYVEGFGLISDALKAVDPTCLVDYCTNYLSTNGGKALDGSPVADLTPASDKYDSQSVDAYDNFYPVAPSVAPTIEAAVAAGKHWAAWEWGLSGKEDVAYIEAMAGLVKGTSGDGPAALGHCYFDKAGSLLGPSVPQSTAAFTAAFG